MTKAGQIGGRERLRLATDLQHQEMHHHPVMACLLAPSVTLAQIETASAVSLGAAREIERARAASGEWAEFSLSDYLQRLHHGLPAHLQTQHAPPVALPTDRYGALGGLYVIHGSAFGATLIANKIRAHLDIDPAPYFPAIDKTNWRRLVATLNAMTEEEADAAVRGACQAFLLFKRIADRQTLQHTLPVTPFEALHQPQPVDAAINAAGAIAAP
ncbi:MAG: hypothetical protein EpisKO_01150 [Epibacterium sp.]